MVLVGCTSWGCVVLCRTLACRVLWEEGAGSELEESWVRARYVRMCVVRKSRLRVRGAAGRRGAGTGLGR